MLLYCLYFIVCLSLGQVKCVCHIHWMTALWCITTAETKIRACSKEADTTQQISEAIEIYYMARQHLKVQRSLYTKIALYHVYN